ncbi:queuosine precursor transporter QueT [Clostridiales bacterium]|nr:queuosine precursor transporter QueT [Clostridiales bacterium]
MKKINTSFIALTGITAAVYMAATLAIAPMGFEAVQFRLSEVMTLLAWVNPSFVPGLVLGCAMANMFSPLGIFDVVFGTFHTFCSVMMMTKTKNMYVASLWPTVFSFIIGFELYVVEKAPFAACTFSVMLGEFICISLIGCVIFTFIRKNEHIMSELQKY